MFIKLTLLNGKDLFASCNHIAALKPDERGSIVAFYSGASEAVQETPEEIMGFIQNTVSTQVNNFMKGFMQ